MAGNTRARSYSYSDTDDDSDYGFDLTAEEEELLDSLVARASEEPTPPPAPAPAPAPVPVPKQTKRKQPTRLSNPAAAPATSSSSLKEDIAAAFASHASVKSLNESTLNFNVRQALANPGFTYRNDPDALSHFAGIRGKSPSTVGGTHNQDTVAANHELTELASVLKPAGAGDVNYPDCEFVSMTLEVTRRRRRRGLTDFKRLVSRALHNVQDTPTIDLDKHKEEESEDEYGFKEIESPLSRFRSFPKKPFSVSDLIAGAWCELQYYYTLTKLPGGKKTRTAAMKGGSKLHKGLEDEVYTTVSVEIAKKEDAFGLRLWNIIQGLRTLRDTRMTRELEVWGLVEGHVVNGVIDHLSYENPDPEFEEEIRSSQSSQEASQHGFKDQQKITTFFHSSSKPEHDQIYLTDVKTTGSRRPPSGAAVRPAKIQLFLYHRFLSDMAAGRLDFLRVFARYGVSPDEHFSDTFVAQIGSLHDEIFEDATDESTSASNKESDSDYRSATSNPSRGPSTAPEFIRYRTLRELVPLLHHELRLTFPQGAESLGSLVTVEYRKRPRRTAEGVEDDDDEEAGTIVGSNVFFVDHMVLQDYLEQDLEWWEGERDPKGVDIEEAGYKCRSCEFVNECEWRQVQDAEMLSKAKKRIASRGKRKDMR
jgi:exonuclease V